MTLAAFLLAAAVQAEPGAGAQVAAIDYRLPPPALLSTRITPENCRRDAAAGEIVVCGRPDEYRIEDPEIPEEWKSRGIPKLGMRVGENATLGPTLQQVELGGGHISKRAMVTLTLGF